MSPDPLLKVEGLTKVFGATRSGFGRKSSAVRAVNGIDLTIASGETYGLVGESGSGKSTLGRCIAMLSAPSEGKVVFEGTDLGTLDREALRGVRRNIQTIFQDPFASLNPAQADRADPGPAVPRA